MRKRKEITEKGNKRKRKEVKGNEGEIGGGGMEEEDGGGKSKSEERVKENESDGGGMSVHKGVGKDSGSASAKRLSQRTREIQKPFRGYASLGRAAP